MQTSLQVKEVTISHYEKREDTTFNTKFKALEKVPQQQIVYGETADYEHIHILRLNRKAEISYLKE